MKIKMLKRRLVNVSGFGQSEVWEIDSEQNCPDSIAKAYIAKGIACEVKVVEKEPASVTDIKKGAPENKKRDNPAGENKKKNKKNSPKKGKSKGKNK